MQKTPHAIEMAPGRYRLWHLVPNPHPAINGEGWCEREFFEAGVYTILQTEAQTLIITCHAAKPRMWFKVQPGVPPPLRLEGNNLRWNALVPHLEFLGAEPSKSKLEGLLCHAQMGDASSLRALATELSKHGYDPLPAQEEESLILPEYPGRWSTYEVQGLVCEHTAYTEREIQVRITLTNEPNASHHVEIFRVANPPHLRGKLHPYTSPESSLVHRKIFDGGVNLPPNSSRGANEIVLWQKLMDWIRRMQGKR